MRTLLEFIARISIFLYFLLGIGTVVALRGLLRGRRRRRVAVFGLDREAAQDQFRRSMNTLVGMLLLASGVYVIENIVVPNMVGPTADVEPTPGLVMTTTGPTPTPNLLLFPTVTPTPGLPPAESVDAEETPSGEEDVVNGCEIIGATITRPTDGETVSGQVAVEGEANILNFSQYKFELRGPATGDAWVVVGSYLTAVPSGLLGVWDSTSLPPGSYALRLIVHRTDGTFVTPCEVPIVVERSSGSGEEATQ